MAFLPHFLPLLRRLELNALSTPPITLPSHFPQRPVVSCPELRELKLISIGRPFMVHQLAYFRQLTHLTIHSSRSSPRTYLIHDVLVMLRHCSSSLVSLHFTGDLVVSAQAESDAHDVVTMERLTSITLRMQSVDLMLQHLTLPRTTGFSVECQDHSKPDFPFAIFIDFLRRSGPPLEALTISRFDIEENDLLATLTLLPSVTRLELYDPGPDSEYAPLSGDFYERLSFTDRDSCDDDDIILPSLVDLCLLFDDENIWAGWEVGGLALVEMVSSRFYLESRPPCSPRCLDASSACRLKTLKRLSLIGASGEYLDRRAHESLGRLEEDGLDVAQIWFPFDSDDSLEGN
ncbi:hypothetical protein V5O48_013105 [Marasmius crinis-equi]|uniref:Uncharacterized protein n=1 Tax=Marasmius crinis-equi TaxID=585013 RepID=A0ABR3F0Z2_9AGAR